VTIHLILRRGGQEGESSIPGGLLASAARSSARAPAERASGSRMRQDHARTARRIVRGEFTAAMLREGSGSPERMLHTEKRNSSVIPRSAGPLGSEESCG
jgi:hypothetical protein